MKTKLGDIKSIEDLFREETIFGAKALGFGQYLTIYTWKCRICGDTVQGTNKRETFIKHMEFHELLERLKLIEQ